MRVIEIMRPGKFKAMNGTSVEFSTNMLKGIAESYDSTIHHSPLVIGHPKVEDPAYGWVKSLDYADGKLKAEPESVVEEFADIVNAGLYKKVSASFFSPDHPANPKPGKYYLKHVGFLGAAAPAVSGLKSVSLASDDANEICIEFAVENDKPESISEQEKENHDLNNEKQEQEFTARQKALEEREKALEAKEAEMKKAEFASFIGDLVKGGRIHPKAKNSIVEFMQEISNSKELTFASDKKQTAIEFFKDYLSKQPKLVEFGEFAGDNKAAPENETPNKMAERAVKLREKLAGEGVSISFSEAVERVQESKIESTN